MRINRLLLISIFAVLTTTSSALTALAQFQPTETFVTSKIVTSVDKLKPGSSFELAVIGTVKKGYHIGAHESTLYPAKLTMIAPKGITFAKPVYPKGKLASFPFAPDEKVPVYEGNFTITLKGQITKSVKPGKITLVAKLDTQACKAEQCYPPQVSESKLQVSVARPSETIKQINTDVFKPAIALTSTPGRGGGGGGLQGLIQVIERSSPLVSFPLLYLIGLILAFTPCIYPMIPVTIGYFGSQGESAGNRKVLGLAAVYVLGIAITYSMLGVTAAVTGGVFGAAMQKPAVIGGIALILVMLAMSMFGLFEIRPPSFIADKASGKSGPAGALLMGLIFGVVAAPCAGPAVISLMLIVANMGKPMLGFLMFFVLALGLGTPLFFLAAFSAKMPVPGMWMVTVKKAAGFLLLGTAAFFALPVMPKEIAPYAVPAVIMAAGIYLGFFEKSLASMRLGSCVGKASCLAALAIATVMLTSHTDKPSITWQTYTPQKLAQAASEGKPVMIDFTAEWCAACQELEKGPFSDAKVIQAAGRFTRLRVDATTDTPDVEMAKTKHGIKGFPTIVFIDSSGKEIESARIVGFVNSNELMKRMEQAK